MPPPLPFSRPLAFLRFWRAGWPQSRARKAQSLCASARAQCLPAPRSENFVSPYGLPASDRTAPPAGLLDSMWQGPEKETARVPPSLDSPQSAAPERFLSRDAVSAFPLKLEPL